MIEQMREGEKGFGVKKPPRAPEGQRCGWPLQGYPFQSPEVEKKKRPGVWEVRSYIPLCGLSLTACKAAGDSPR